MHSYLPNQKVLKMAYFTKHLQPIQLLRAAILIYITLFIAAPSYTYAASATEINIGVDETLKRFRSEVPGGSEFLKRAKGILVFPNVIKAGFWIGGEYGEGALRIDGQTKAYYGTAAASIGLQAGAQTKSVVLVFMTDDSLVKFQQSEGWKAGVDGSVSLVQWGAAEDINTIDIQDPIVGFVFSNKGLMFNLTLEGSKFTKIVK